jgi:bacillopeptidase F (M6 metalloprotease family)
LHEQKSQAFGKSSVSYQPITGRQRFNWFVRSTIGPESLAAGMFTAGFGTAINRPQEYGTHWDGYAKRYGIRFTGISTGNAMEAAFGSLWGEDPRYFRATGQSFRGG